MMRTRLAKVLDREDVRQMCIAHQYYTRGDCRAYENMLGLLDLPRSKYTGSNISAVKLEEIAEDIKDHSNTEDSVLDIMQTLAVHIHTNVTPVRKGKAHRV